MTPRDGLPERIRAVGDEAERVSSRIREDQEPGCLAGLVVLVVLSGGVLAAPLIVGWLS